MFQWLAHCRLIDGAIFLALINYETLKMSACKKIFSNILNSKNFKKRVVGVIWRKNQDLSLICNLIVSLENLSFKCQFCNWILNCNELCLSLIQGASFEISQINWLLNWNCTYLTLRYWSQNVSEEVVVYFD